MPKVSVLLPVYNGEKYLAEAITSILDQSFKDFELLILNDGSTDRSVKIIESFSDPRIRLYHNPTNLKLIATLNKGLELASGEYIARMDADDISEITRFEKQVHFLDLNKDCVVVGSNYSAFGEQSFVSNLNLTDKKIRIAIYFENPVAHPSVMMRASSIKLNNLSYRKEMLHLEDWGLWNDLLKQGQIINLAESLISYRITEQSISVINRGTIEQRYKRFYKIVLADLFDEISPEMLDCHYQISSGIYTNSSLKSIKKYSTELRKKLISRSEKKAEVNVYLNKKLKKLFFSVAYNSRTRGLNYLLKFRFVDMSLFQYLFSPNLKKNGK